MAEAHQSELSERTDGELSDHFDYVMLKVKQEKLTSDDIKELEKLVNEKDAVLCKIQRIIHNWTSPPSMVPSTSPA